MEICLNHNIIKEWNRKNFITNDDLDLICDITVQLNFVEFKQIIKFFLYIVYYWSVFWSRNIIWLESSEVDNVRTSGLKRFSCRKISVQDLNEGLSITSNCTGFIFVGFIIWFFRIWGTLWMPDVNIILHLKRINSFEVYLIWIRNSNSIYIFQNHCDLY